MAKMATHKPNLPQQDKERGNVIPISRTAASPVAGPDYKVMVVSDLHMNRPFRDGATAEDHQARRFTYFGNEMADGFFKSLKHVDELVIAGDMFDIDQMVREREKANSKSEEPLPFEAGSWQKRADEKDQYWLRNRSNPEAFLEQILEENPHLKVTYLIGNHDGESAAKYGLGSARNGVDDSKEAAAKVEHLEMLEKLRQKYTRNGYSRFSYDDTYQKNNLLVMHGHAQIEYDKMNSEKGGTYHFYTVYQNSEAMSDRANHGPIDIIVRPKGKNGNKIANTKMAKAIISTDAVRNAIASYHSQEKAGRDAEAVKDFYVAFGHRHHSFDVAITRDDFTKNELDKDPHEELSNMRLHVTDMGHTRSPNFKVYHFNEGEVSRMETINLKSFSKNGIGRNGNGGTLTSENSPQR